MPVIGTNKIEGGFFKSQIDYVLNDYWTGEAYIDYLSQKGIGLEPNSIIPITTPWMAPSITTCRR